MCRKADGRVHRESVFGRFNSFIQGQFFRSLSSLRPITLLCPPITDSTPWLICLGTLPWVPRHTWAKMDLKVKASGRSKTHYGLELSPDFWLQEAFLHLCNVFLILYSDRVFASLCPCHDYSLEIFTRDKTVYLPCFCCSLHFREQTGGWLLISQLEPTYLLPQEMQRGWLFVNVKSGAHLSPISNTLCSSSISDNRSLPITCPVSTFFRQLRRGSKFLSEPWSFLLEIIWIPKRHFRVANFAPLHLFISITL